METKELRLGNYIWFNDAPVKDGFAEITAVNDELVHTTQGAAYSSELQGIELTEEWLVKFGNWDITEEGLLSYDLKYDEQLEEWLFYVYNLRGDKINCAMIKYVHQLQNLYFALTGKELERHEKNNRPKE